MKLQDFIVFLSLLHISNTLLNCPEECKCGLDDRGRRETLCLKGGMKTLPIQSFDPNVEVIIIRGPNNNLHIGPIFAPFKKLEILKITDSNVPAIGLYSFWGVQSLRIIDLSRNNITTIMDNNFRGQDGLHELDLSHNKIHTLPSQTFYHLKELRRLNLADTSIEELRPRLFYLLSKLKYLDLSGNSLIDLPPDVFKDISQLKELRCRNCNLKKINPQVYNLLPHLTDLDIGDNQLKYLEKEEFHDLRRLKMLRIDGNQLSVVIDNLFIKLRSLEILDLSRNRLAKVTNDAFTSLTNLTYLDLSYNKLTRLEAASMEPLKSLYALNISGNVQLDLFEIRSAFQMLQGLKSLFVADMGPLPLGLLVPFTQLRSLNLSGNHLDNISLQILNPLSKLELLDLSRNQLNGISDGIAAKLQKIKDVKLENNPLICDRCHMGSLIDLADLLNWYLPPVCFLPESLRGAPINELNSNALEECMEFIHDEGYDAASTSHNFLERGNINALAFLCGIVFVLIAAIVLISVVCYSRHRARYYTHEEKRSDATEKTLDAPSITQGNEINFTFHIDDRVCTIDDIILPPPPSHASSQQPSVPLQTSQQPLATSAGGVNGKIGSLKE